MFTGLVECTGKLTGRGGGKLQIIPERVWDDLCYGESIAVNGCCLTLEKVISGNVLEFHTMEESLRRTNLGSVPIGGKVNLERAMCAGGRLGGHIVQGHIDCTRIIREFKKTADGDVELLVSYPESDAELIVEKGSIAIDGISLTVVEAGRDFFGVRLIPVTLQETALRFKKVNDAVNLEYDILGRYVLRHFDIRDNEKRGGKEITMDTLRDAGFL